MRRIVTGLLCCLFLTGCSFSIDEEESVDVDAFYDELDTKPVPTDDALYLPAAEPVPIKEETFVEKLSDFLGIQLPNGQEEDARPLYYLALGDSLTRGVGDESKQYGYTGRLADVIERWPLITEVELDNRGKNGRRSDQLLKLLKKGHYDEELANSDLITMTMGGNDVMKVVKKDLFALEKPLFDKELIKYKKRYQKILNEIRAINPNAPLILIGFYNPFSIVTDEVTTFEPIISEWNDAMNGMAEADQNACFVPIDDLFDSNADLVYHTDFFHPNAKGYERMATRVIERMQACDIEAMSEGLIGFEE